MPEDADAASYSLDGLRTQQLLAWHRGERLLVEELIADVTPVPVDNELLELIYAEVMLRAERGETCHIDEYLQRFPQFAGRLRRLFAKHEGSEAPTGDRPSAIRPAAKALPRSSDRNLLFGILALQVDFISRDALIDALRDWTTQKEKTLWQILVERGDLSASRRELLEPLVDEHVRQHDGDPAASLASISSVIEGTVDWHRVHDVDVAESLAVRRLTRNTHRSEAATATSSGAATDAGRFRVLRPHAKGGIGEVFLAFDEELHREVALKEIQSRHLQDESQRERFVREAEVTGGLEHPGIVPVYSLGHHGDGRPFYAMRFIRGDSLKEAIERFHLPVSSEPVRAPADVNAPTIIGAVPAEAESTVPNPGKQRHFTSRQQFESVEFRKLLGRFIDVCQAIEYAHSRGVLHRDLKPGNIMLGKYGETLVVDWGLAKVAGKSDRFANVDEATLVPSSGSSIEQTADGSIVGTPAYMSPEQAAGRLQQLGPATDVYSLGATLYHILTGRLRFERLSRPELLRRIQTEEFPRPREINSAIPKSLESVCLKAMALLPEARYESSAAIAEDIEHWLADEPVSACRETMIGRAARWVRKHRAWALSGTAALALVAVVATVAAFWINGQMEVISQQEREATKLATRNATLANEKSKLADEKAQLAEKEKANAQAASRQTKLANQRLYFSHMNLVQVAWENNRLGNMRETLEYWRPRLQPNEFLTDSSDRAADDFRCFEWFYWERLAHSYQVNLDGHTGRVYCVAFSPDGQRVASASADQTIKVWNATNGQELFTLKGHTEAVRSVVFSPDGKLLASVSGVHGKPPEVKIWNAETGQRTFALNGLTNEVRRLVFSPNGKWLAIAANDKTLRMWDAVSGQESSTQDGHASGITCVAFSPDGECLASSSWDSSVKVWETGAQRVRFTLKGNGFAVADVEFSPDGKRLAFNSVDGTLKVCDASTGQELHTLRGNRGPVIFAPNGRLLLAVNDDHAVKDTTVKVWETESGQEAFTLKGHSDRVSAVAFSSDGRWIATASDDQTVKVWDTESGLETMTLKGHTSGIANVAFSPDSRRLLTASDDGTAKLWKSTVDHETLASHSHWVLSVAFSPDGKRLASASYDQTIRVWDISTGQMTQILGGHAGPVTGVAFSPDGKRLASSSWDGFAVVWDSANGEALLKLKGHAAVVTAVAFSPDGQQLASAGDDHTVKLWDARTGDELFTLKGHETAIWSVSFSPNGQRLVSTSNDPAVRLWNTDNGLESLTLSGHKSAVRDAAFSSDGKWLATASDDETVKVWDLAAGRESLTLSGHTAAVRSVMFSPDGQRIASASDDKTIKIWDTMSGHLTLTLKGHTLELRGVAFSQDGNLLASASRDKTIRIWNATPQTHLK